MEATDRNPWIAVALWTAAVAAMVLAQRLIPDRWPDYVQQTVGFAILWAALFPLARYTWLRGMPVWRYWAGLLIGLPVGFALSLASHGGLSDRTQAALISIVAAFFLLIPQWRRVGGDLPLSARFALQALGVAFLGYGVWLLNAG